jgi:hypothetical protein
MSQYQEFQRIVEQAKQRRAECVGSAMWAHRIPIAGTVVLALVLLHFIGEPQQHSAGKGAELLSSQDATADHVKLVEYVPRGQV